MNPKKMALWGGALLGLAGGVSLAEQLTVGTRAVEVVAEQATDADTVELVPVGGKLDVLGKSGGWLQVRTPGGKTGYVLETVVVKKSGGLNLSALTGGPSASDASASMAGRGLSEQAGTFARSHGYKTDAPDKMVAMRQKYKADLKAFKSEGNVGVSK